MEESKNKMITDPHNKVMEFYDDGTDTGRYMRTYPSVYTATLTTKIHRKDIIDCCNGVISSTGKYRWRWYEKKLKPNGKNANHTNHTVLMYDIYGNYIKTFFNSKSAANFVGVKEETVRKCLNGEYRTAGGYKFKWKESLDV